MRVSAAVAVETLGEGTVLAAEAAQTQVRVSVSLGSPKLHPSHRELCQMPKDDRFRREGQRLHRQRQNRNLI